MKISAQASSFRRISVGFSVALSKGHPRPRIEFNFVLFFHVSTRMAYYVIQIEKAALRSIIRCCFHEIKEGISYGTHKIKQKHTGSATAPQGRLMIEMTFFASSLGRLVPVFVPYSLCLLFRVA